MKACLRLICVLLWALSPASAQVIEFESGGLQYQTLTKDGVTIMFAHMPAQIRQYAMIQVAVTNGSSIPCTVRPEDFQFEISPGATVRAVPAIQVINQLVRGASGGDVIKLVTTYETGLYGMQRAQSTNGYEQRRQAALALASSKGLKAAAAASAIAFVETTLQPGASTDGAVFYPLPKTSGESVLRVNADGREFEFHRSLPVWAVR